MMGRLLGMKYQNETVSVIIPVYNAERYISDTIESVLNQTYKDIEIVLVDDCSNDNSKTIIEAYAKKNDGIIYHLQKENGGAAVARNTALSIASGRYIAFLDSDDLWLPEKIKKQMDLIKENSAAICFTAIEMMDENGKMIKDKRNVKNKINYNFLLKNTMIATSSVLIDREVVGNFQMPLIRSGQDYATWLQLMRGGLEAYGINEVLVKYRVGRNSLSSNKLKSIKQVWCIQTRQEQINIISSLINVVYFCTNGIKKYFFTL